MADNTKTLFTFGALGVAAYFLYQWYYGSGGQADQSVCGTAMTPNQVPLAAAEVISAAANANTTPAAFLASWAAANPTQPVQAACLRVAFAKYPTIAAAQAAATAATTSGGIGISQPGAASPAITPTTPTITPTPAPTTTTVVSTAPAPTTPAFNSLDAIYTRLAASVGNQQLDPDGFNFYLNQQLPSGVSAPDPLAVFTQAGFDRTQSMSLANYWGAVAPYLSAHMGLSGLGILGGLYDHMRRTGGLYGRRSR